MYGMDISKWQRSLDLTRGNYDFCIVKATEGIGYKDPSFEEREVQLTELNKLIGTYHFARPDLHKTVNGMKDEANYYLEVLDKYKLIGRSIMVLDWEKEPYNNESMVAAFLEEVYSKTGIKPFIYGSRSKLSKWSKWGIMKQYPIWMAVWPSVERADVGVNPGYKLPSKETIPWVIWQYSATGRYPEYNGNVDLDYTEITPEQWIEYCVATNEPDEPEEINKYMQWAIDNGLFVGDGNGHYRPKDPLTREEAATVLYQFYNNLVK